MPDPVETPRYRAAQVIAQYDWEHGIIANREPRRHTFGEIDALLDHPDILRELAASVGATCGESMPPLIGAGLHLVCAEPAGHDVAAVPHRDVITGATWWPVETPGVAALPDGNTPEVPDA